MGWVIFSHTDFAEMGTYLGSMAGIGAGGLIGRAGLYALKSNALLLALSVLCCHPALRRWQVRGTGRHPILWALALGALMIACTAYLVHGSYNPFLYFRF